MPGHCSDCCLLSLTRQCCRTPAFADPHTSSLDYVWFHLFRKATGLECRWVAKKELFYFPLGCFNRALGGMPVDRSGGKGAVAAFAQLFEGREELAIVLAPSGARRYRDHWKTGFYYIAQQAGVPVLCAYLDYKRKVVGVAPEVVHLTGDMPSDMDTFRRIYAGTTGRNPKRQNPVRLLPEDSWATKSSPLGAPQEQEKQARATPPTSLETEAPQRCT